MRRLIILFVSASALMLQLTTLFFEASVEARSRGDSNLRRHHPSPAPESTGEEDGLGALTDDEGGGEGGGGGRGGEDGEHHEENCSMHCVTREVKKNYRIESIKIDILRKLRLSAPPNVTGKRLPSIPQLQEILKRHGYHNSSMEFHREDDFDDTYATPMQQILFSQPAHPEIAPNNSTCYFPFTSDLHYQLMQKAEFGVYIRRPTPWDPSYITWILVYTIEPQNPGQPPERKLIRRKRIQLNSEQTNHWHYFDVKAQVDRWLTKPNVSYAIQVQCSDARGEPLAIIQPRNRDEELLKPYMEIRLKEQASSRPKRTVDLDCDEQSSEKRCCRYPLVVDFEQFRWDWVIVPKRYSAYYCSGECPFLYYQRHPYEHIFQQSKPDSSGSGPCCSPRKVSQISMLYYDEHMNIVYGRLPSMVVDQCGCS